MKAEHVLIGALFLGLNLFGHQMMTAKEYVKRLAQLGSRVQNASEADMSIRAKLVPYSNDLLDTSRFNCETAMSQLGHAKSGGDCLIVIRSRQELALNTFFDQIAPGVENNSVRASMKNLMKEMDALHLYVIGHREDGEDVEVSGWYLVGKFDGEVILLSHERVFT